MLFLPRHHTSYILPSFSLEQGELLKFHYSFVYTSLNTSDSYATTLLTAAHTCITGTLYNILLKWEVTLLGTSIHCLPFMTHIYTQNSTQHYWYLFQPLLPDFKNIHLSLETDSECIQPPPSAIARSKSSCWGCTGTSRLSNVFSFAEFNFLESLKIQLHAMKIRQFTLTIHITMHIHRYVF